MSVLVQVGGRPPPPPPPPLVPPPPPPPPPPVPPWARAGAAEAARLRAAMPAVIARRDRVKRVLLVVAVEGNIARLPSGHHWTLVLGPRFPRALNENAVRRRWGLIHS